MVLNRHVWVLAIILVAGFCRTLSAEAGRDWTRATAAAPWRPRCGMPPVVYNGKMWVIGGWADLGGSVGDVWYSSNGASWVAARPTLWDEPTWRAGHATVVYSGKMWLIGGHGAGPQNDVWYSTNGTTWTRATASAPWQPRSSHGAVVFNGKMWVIGGGESSNNLFNDVWYSTNGVSWTRATTHAQFSARSVDACFVYDGRIWLIGGFSSGPNKDVWYSYNGTTWTRVLAQGPWRGYGASGVAAGGKMWVMGGTGAEHGTIFSVNDIWCSKDGVHWTEVTPQAAWIPRGDFPIVVFNRRIWILGGELRFNSDSIFLNDVWYTDIPTDAGPSWKLYR